MLNKRFILNQFKHLSRKMFTHRQQIIIKMKTYQVNTLNISNNMLINNNANVNHKKPQLYHYPTL